MNTIEQRAVYLEVEAEVRYWEDAKVNGQEDTNGTLMPFRKNDVWNPSIRLSDGSISGWPTGSTANIHYKVCNAGEYWLLDEAGRRIAKWGGYYVPNEFLCHGPDSNGFGDYIIFKVGPDGVIQNYRRPSIEVACSCDDEDDEQSKWKPLESQPNAKQEG